MRDHDVKIGWQCLLIPTSRNAKGIDIVAYSGDFKVIRKIQVKSFSKIQAVSFGRDKETFNPSKSLSLISTPAPFFIVLVGHSVRYR